jgi:predicted transcriptional regulator
MKWTDVVLDILKVAMKEVRKSHDVCEVNFDFKIADKYLEILNENNP